MENFLRRSASGIARIGSRAPGASRTPIFRSRRAFTLIELVVVVMIASTLAVVAVGSMIPAVENAKADSAKSLMTQLGRANQEKNVDGQQYSVGTIDNRSALIVSKLGRRSNLCKQSSFPEESTS